MGANVGDPHPSTQQDDRRAKQSAPSVLKPHLSEAFKLSPDPQFIDIQEMANQPLHHDFQRITESGVKPNLAKLTLP